MKAAMRRARSGFVEKLLDFPASFWSLEDGMYIVGGLTT